METPSKLCEELFRLRAQAADQMIRLRRQPDLIEVKESLANTVDHIAKMQNELIALIDQDATP